MSAEANKALVRRYFRDLADNTNPAAAGEILAIGAINLFTVRDGRVAVQRVVFDSLGLLQQLGAIPAAG